MSHSVAALVAISLATTATAAEPSDSFVATGPDVEAIRALIEQARKADLAGDRSFYERFLTDDFTLGTGTGQWESKQSKLAYLGSDRHAVNSEAISDLRVRVHGTAAIATFTATIEGSWEKKPFHVTAIITQTWVKEASGWKLAATHGSRREERGGSATDSAQAGAAPVSGAIPMAGWSATYVTEGQGLPCIVVSLRHYHLRTFSPRFKGALRCTFLDARFSVPEAAVDPKAPYTVAAAVEDLEAARKALGMTRFVLVGHSIQGSIALAYALRYPQHVSHVIAIGAVPGLSPALGALAKDHWDRNASPARKASFAAAQKAFQAAAPGLAPADHPPAMIRAEAAKRWYDPEYDERPLLAGAPLNMPLLGQLFGQPFELLAGGAWVQPPALVALGRHDYVVPPTAWDGQSAHFRDLTLVHFERAGHTPQLETAAEFDDRVLAWLRTR